MINAYYNGIFMNAEDVRLGLSDRAVFFGDGIYDAAIGRNGKVFMLDEHLCRFIKNASELNINLPVTYDSLSEIIHKLINLSEESMYFIYFQATRRGYPRMHTYDASLDANLLITVSKFMLPEESKELKLITLKDTRYELCHLKTLNLLPSVIASQKASFKGADEAIFVRRGIVTECSHSNIHLIKGSTLYTHPCNFRILPGIARQALIEICKRNCIRVVEKPFKKSDLFDSDGVLITSTSKLCLSASVIDGVKLTGRNTALLSLLTAAARDEFLRKTE